MASKVNKKAKWPDEAELKAMDKVLAKVKGSAGLPASADTLDHFKYALCGEFVKYCVDHDLTQRDLAEQLEISEARISEIVRYRINKLTTDRLIKYLGKLKIKFKFSLAS